MKGRDEIKDLFSDKLGNFEAQVRPEIWTSIASQLGGTASTAASTGLSLLSKTFIGLGIGAAVVTTLLVLMPGNKDGLTEKPTEKITSSTSIEETTLEDNQEGAVPMIASGDENTIKTQVEKSPSKLENIEIDQTHNFRSEVSLIDVTKEKLSITSVMDKKEENKKQIEEKQKNKKTASTTEGKVEKTEQQEPTVQERVNLNETYSLANLPNVFTPNGDGNNDVLSIISEGLIDFTIVVFDEKQNVVFESNNTEFNWDGIDKYGNKVKAGTYGYYIIAKDSNGNKVNKFMSLQIVF